MKHELNYAIILSMGSLRGIIVFLLVAASLSCTSCLAKNSLKTEAVNDADITGSYTLILFGCTHAEDLETFAILDKEGDNYILDPFSPEFNYRVKTGLSAKRALAEAENFINCHSAYQRPQLIRLVNKKGSLVGYEVKPRYLSVTYSVDTFFDNETDVYSYKRKTAKRNSTR